MKNAAAILFAAFLLGVEPALAHNAPLGLRGFPGGLLHPLAVPSHLAMLVAVGLFIGQQGRPTVLLVAFAAGLAIGLVAIMRAVVAYDAEYAVLAVAATLGGLVVIARPLPTLLGGALAIVAGIAIELDSVPDDVSMIASFVALVGTLMSASVLVLLVSRVAATRRRDWERIGVRVVGSWIAASAVLVLVLRLAR